MRDSFGTVGALGLERCGGSEGREVVILVVAVDLCELENGLFLVPQELLVLGSWAPLVVSKGRERGEMGESKVPACWSRMLWSWLTESGAERACCTEGERVVIALCTWSE